MAVRQREKVMHSTWKKQVDHRAEVTLQTSHNDLLCVSPSLPPSPLLPSPLPPFPQEKESARRENERWGKTGLIDFEKFILGYRYEQQLQEERKEALQLEEAEKRKRRRWFVTSQMATVFVYTNLW